VNRVASATVGDFITRKSRGLERGLTGPRGCYARELCVAAQRHAHLFAQLLIHPARRCWNGYRRACRISVRPGVETVSAPSAPHARSSTGARAPYRDHQCESRYRQPPPAGGIQPARPGPVRPSAGGETAGSAHPPWPWSGRFSRPLAGRSRLANDTSRTVPGIFPIGRFCVAAGSRKLPVCSGGYRIIVGAR
jgi:hypothetical protein